ncbi:putative flavin-containing monooxygenase [Pavlovales sp. CCMP2436]|nr:putative flavin-containing monooxygenase [Pavlovales sp. CCMP2436]|mmetsp:Transcript_34294/g.85450  ORF Transcript_34294/g.85450 Transcript_34294/m.85450 type:complete len:474 (-) Transcript_34294:288-1709(-)
MAAVNGTAPTERRQRVAVIGGGPAGISALAAFQAAAAQGARVPEVVLFDRQSEWGGTWNLPAATGLDEFGEVAHSAMYRHLWSNGPKECLELPSFPFSAAFGPAPLPSYPPRDVLRRYLHLRAEHLGLAPHCRLRTAVRDVRCDGAMGRLALTAHDLPADRVYTEHFDFVIVATGHYSTPVLPEIPGLSRFRGRVLHAKAFCDAAQFAGSTILIVGASESAEDVGQQLLKFGAKRVVNSFRSTPLDYVLPQAWTQRPLLLKIEQDAGGADVCHFADGTEEREIDAIVLCTGYRHHFPFLQDELRLVTENRLWPQGLYKGTAWEKDPRVFYLGMQDQYFTFTFFEAQAWWARDVILGVIKLPAAEAMAADSERERAREEACVTHGECIRFQGAHLQTLLSATDCPAVDVDAVCAIFEQWERDKRADFFGYRDRAHRSVVTGTMAAAPHRRWAEEMDDSAESFLASVPAPNLDAE